MPRPPDLSQFEGRWTLTRRIEAAGAVTGTFTGEAIFERADTGLALSETGTLTMAGQTPLHAERRYLWQADGAGGIDIRFADGRQFHRIDLASPRPTALHLCDPDRYEVAYDFTDWPVWRTVWTVTGPRKGYTMASVHHRL